VIERADQMITGGRTTWTPDNFSFLERRY
jgi:hypothetical protein